jgi:predicted transcriptional regulator
MDKSIDFKATYEACGKRFTIRYIADRIGVSEATIYNWINGSYGITSTKDRVLKRFFTEHNCEIVLNS